MNSQNPDTVSYSEGTDLATPITVAFDGRTRQRFERVVDDDPAARTAARAKTRLKVQTTAEAEALLSALAGMDLLRFDPQMIPTLHRVRDELRAALETRGYAVADGHVQELVADGSGVPQSFKALAGTCESCGEDVDPERLIEGECPGCQYRPDVATDGGGQTLPVQLRWRRTDDGVEPSVNLQGEELEAFLDARGVDSLNELIEQRGLERYDSCRLGKATRYQTGDGYRYEFASEVELLQRVDGIDETLARGFISEYDDIPSICKWRRESGDIFLGDLLHDVKAAGYDWEEELEVFIEEMPPTLDGGIEKLLKEAGEWVEPDTAVADGGLHTVEHDGTDYVVCHMVAYENANDPEIEYEDGDPVVTNHDEIPKYDEVRLLTLDSVEENDLHHMAISPSSSLWEDEFEELEPGDAVRVSQETFTDGGGVTWTDLHAFQRDCLEAIRRLDNEGETTYGLAIKRELERRYGEEVNHGRLYPNLDDLVDAGLVEKSELDNRTNSYDLTSEGKAMLERRARTIADACGMQQPVADGGDSA